MGGQSDTQAEFIAYAEHCEQMAEASQNEEEKNGWLTLAAAWRRRATPNLTDDQPE